MSDDTKNVIGEYVLRNDHTAIAKLVQNNTRILDLGCAEGNLLQFLRKEKNATVYGVEQDKECIPSLLKKNIPVYHGDILEGLSMFPNASLDVAVLSRTVQELHEPDLIIDKMLQKAKHGIVSFLNYGYYKNRVYTLLSGSKPVSYVSQQPWPFHTEMKPVSIRDFESYALAKNYKVVQRRFLNGDWSRPVRFLPNLTCGVAIFVLQRK